MNDKFVTAVDS